MMKKVFLDTNILMDFVDRRVTHRSRPRVLCQLKHRPALLQASQLGGQNPLNWGTPGDDR